MKTTISLFGALVLAATAVRALVPPPDGGYPNENTAEGDSALFNVTTGFDDTALGFDALVSDTTGFNNTAIGADALFDNTTGSENTAIGFEPLFSNTTGAANTATGDSALVLNTTGNNNTANGSFTLSSNSTGNNNTAVGFQALQFNSTGSGNIALGFLAGSKLTTGNNNIEIGNKGLAGESKTIRIGIPGNQQATFIAGISGVTVGGGIGVIVDSSGHLGTIVSSERFKDSIKPMDKASEAILSLQPVTFRYKHELDPDGIPQFGLVAEQVEKVNPDLVARDEQGKPYTVRYEAVNAMLLNEFLKEHRKVEKQSGKQQKLEATVAQQQKEIQALTAALKAQAAQIQKVSDQVKASKPAPRLIADSQ